MSRGPAFPLPCTPDDVVRCALAAYYRAVGDATPPIGEPDPGGWSDPAYLVETLCDFFTLKLRVETGSFDAESSEPDRYARWSGSPLSRDQTFCQAMGPDEGCLCGKCQGGAS